MSASQPAFFNLQEFTDAGQLLVGGRLYTYFPGTTIMKAAYADEAATIPHTYTADGLGGQFIALDARGELPAPLYMTSGSYDLTLKRADGSMVWSRKSAGVENGLNGLITSLVSMSGASRVGFSQGSVGAVPVTLESALRNAFSISYANFATDQQHLSILAGADATLFLLAAIESLPSGGRLHGSGSVFNVTSLPLKSNITLSYLALKTKAGTADFCSPITINGQGGEKTNIHLIDVTIDGNRINQTNIIAGAEDGGRHGFRLIGAMSNITLERCQANYCAGDGIELFSGSSATANDANYVFQKVSLRDCTFNYNRRHGMSADSVKHLRMDNVELNYNGLDLNTIDPQTSGGRGARVGASLYGNGIDFEGYGLGSGLLDLRMTMITALYNARQGVLFYDAVETRGAGFVPRVKIWISDSYFDEGTDVSRSGEALAFTSTISSKALAKLYDSIYLKNVRLDGRLTARCVSNLQFDGEITATGSFYAVLDYAAAASLSVAPRGAATTIYSENSTYSLDKESIPSPAAPVLAFSAGVAGTLSAVTASVLENARDRTVRYLITADWLASAAGVPVFTITPAIGGVIAAAPRVDVISNANALPVPCSYLLTIGNFRFNDPGTGLMKIQIVVDVKI